MLDHILHLQERESVSMQICITKCLDKTLSLSFFLYGVGKYNSVEGEQTKTKQNNNLIFVSYYLNYTASENVTALHEDVHE